MHWPGAGILIVLSLAIVSLLYSYLGLGLFNNMSIRSMFVKESYSRKNKFNYIFGVVFGLVLATLVIGSLFKFMLWPGGNILLIIGLFLLLFSVTFYLIVNKYGKVSLPMKSFTRIIIISFISISLYVIQSDEIINFYYPNDSAYAEALKKIIDNPADSLAQENFLKLKQDRMTIKRDSRN